MTTPHKPAWMTVETIMPVVVVALIGCLFLAAIYDYKQGRANPKWPAANGIIIDSKVEIEIIPTEVGNMEKHKAKIVYAYTVNSTEYTCDKVASGINTFAEAIVKKYPPGKNVVVYYNPANPEDAVLEIGIKLGNFWAFIVLGLIFMFVIFIAIAVRIHEKFLPFSIAKHSRKKHVK